MQVIQVYFSYDQVFTVDSIGKSCGLDLFYMNEPNVRILYSDNRMIDVDSTLEGKKIFMTFVYEDPVKKYRERVWEGLTRMSFDRLDDWFMIGDINEITKNHENRGGRRRTEASFLNFQNMLVN